MFGVVVANLEALTEEQRARYKGAYCGLCRTLQQRHGDLSRLTLIAGAGGATASRITQPT